MTPEHWRDLVDAYVSGRLSADAFKRRFTEAYDEAARTRAPTPSAIQDLAYVVQAYAGDPTARGHDVADDAALMDAALIALEALPAPAPIAGETRAADERDPSPPVRPPEVIVHVHTGGGPFGGGPYGGGRGPETPHVRRAAFAMGAEGAVGCLAIIAWLLLGLLQFFAIAAQIDAVLGWGPAPSTIVAFPLAFVPIIGSAIAFFGAMDVWGWNVIVAGVVFLALPALSLFGGWRQRRHIRFGRGP
jgi:hypothetical protein